MKPLNDGSRTMAGNHQSTDELNARDTLRVAARAVRRSISVAAQLAARDNGACVSRPRA